MARLHVFEFEDQSWFPALLRAQMTDYLVYSVRLLRGFPSYAASRLAPALRARGQRRLVDLGSGSGGVMPEVVRALADEQEIQAGALLTDRYPSGAHAAEAREKPTGRVDFHPDPVDATHVPADLHGARTLFLSFHHFRPEPARKILADAVRAGSGIAIFELTERRLISMLGAVPGIPIMVLLLTPFIRPFQWSRLLFTYLLPILPLLIFWDGLVSHLRTYSVEELEQLVAELDAPDWHWDVRRERLPGMPAACTSLVGYPRTDPAPESASSTSRS
jgi:hypothetical protein